MFTSCWMCVAVTCMNTILGTTTTMLWKYSAKNLEARIRYVLFQKILEQEISWFDDKTPENITARYFQDINEFVRSQGVPHNLLWYALGEILFGIAIAIYMGYILTMLFICVMMVTCLSVGFWVWSIKKKSVVAKNSYLEAGASSIQTFSGIKTVKFMNGEEHESERYFSFIDTSKNQLTYYTMLSGSFYGQVMTSIIFLVGTCFYIGAVFVVNNTINPNFGETYTTAEVTLIIQVLFSVMFDLGNILSFFECIMKGKEAAYRIYQVINRKPKINVNDKTKITPKFIEGHIRFMDVGFSYPSNLGVNVLEGQNLEIPIGKRVAFVGETGCGKSTAFGLIQRLFDCNEGHIYIDGIDIKDYNLTDLNKFIGYVGQEPTLYAMSIKENLLQVKPNASDIELITVLEQANAWEFVKSLEKKMDTFVGGDGSQLSGGQKQRIAIARAILRKPPILLFDEATSALDSKNQELIQDTIREVVKGKTTITIAHRLETIQSSDIIFVFQDKKVVAKGTHEELLKDPEGVYSSLIKIQLACTGDVADSQEKDIPEASNIRNDLKQNLIRSEKKIPGTIQNITDLDETQYSTHPPNFLDEESLNLLDPEDRKNMFSGKNSKPPAKRSLPYKRIWDDLKGRHFSIFAALTCAVLSSCWPSICGYLVGDLLDVMFNAMGTNELVGQVGINVTEMIINHSIEENYVLNKERASLTFIRAMILVVYSLILLCTMNSIGANCAEFYTNKLRKKYFTKLINADYQFFQEENNSVIRICDDLDSSIKEIQATLTTNLIVMLHCFCSVIFGVGLAMYNCLPIALGSIGVFLITVILSSKMYSDLTQQGLETSGSNDSAIVQESIINMRTTRACNVANSILAKFKDLMKKRSISFKGSLASSLNYALSVCSSLIFCACMYLLVAQTLKYSDHTSADVMHSALPMLYVMLIVASNLTLMESTQTAYISAQKVYDFLDTKNAIKSVDENRCKLIKDGKGKIEFINVSFRYPSREDYVFEDMSFVIEAGKNVAFVGHSGVGKSTIVLQMLRFYEPSEGSILLDGVDIRDISLKNLRDFFGVVGQEPFLFNESIEYNIRYNRYGLSFEKIEEAAKKAEAHKFITQNEWNNEAAGPDDSGNPKKLVSGYDKVVGNKGTKQSGGQKQRVAIARAIVREPKVYLFDEATSALDTETENEIQKSLEAIGRDKTSIYIAHRLNTIKNCDVIMLIDEKNIVESGTYDELCERKELFWNLFNLEKYQI